MKRNARLNSLLVCISFAVVAFMSPVNAQTPTPDLPTYEELLEFARQLRVWNVVIDFKFEDDDGRPLDNVRVSTDVTQTGGWNPKIKRSRFESPGSSIHLEYEDVICVGFVFGKDGYGGQKFELLFMDPPNWAEIIPDKREQRYVKTIVLKKDGPRKARRGETTGLTSIYGGKADIFIMTDFHLPSVSRPSEEHPWTFSGMDRGIEVTTNTLVLDDPYFYLDIADDPTEEGVYISVDPFSSDLSAIVPTGKAMELGLRSNNPDDGIIMVQPELSDHQKITSTSEMYPLPDRTDVAPDSGYQPRIRIPHELYVKNKETPTPKLYFFFRVDGYYGRGILQRAGVGDDFRVDASLMFEIQADGTPEIDF
jgi:hypothetical protein